RRDSGEVYGQSDVPGASTYDVLDGWGDGNIQSISGSMIDDGRAFLTVEGGDPLRVMEELWDRRIQRANANSPSEWTSPFPDGKPEEQPSTTIPSFTFVYVPPRL